MFLEPFLTFSAFAVAIVRAKYPEEFNDPKNKFIIFDLVELVGEDLEKNISIFVQPVVDNLVSVEDFQYGDKAIFHVVEPWK